MFMVYEDHGQSGRPGCQVVMLRSNLGKQRYDFKYFHDIALSSPSMFICSYREKLGIVQRTT